MLDMDDEGDGEAGTRAAGEAASLFGGGGKLARSKRQAASNETPQTPPECPREDARPRRRGDCGGRLQRRPKGSSPAAEEGRQTPIPNLVCFELAFVPFDFKSKGVLSVVKTRISTQPTANAYKTGARVQREWKYSVVIHAMEKHAGHGDAGPPKDPCSLTETPGCQTTWSNA